MNREGPGTFQGEGLVLPGAETPSVQVNMGAAIAGLKAMDSLNTVIAALDSTNPFTEVVSTDPFNILNQPNGKNPPLKYADLGGAIVCNHWDTRLL